MPIQTAEADDTFDNPYLVSMVNALPTAPTVTIYFHFKSKSFARIHQSCTCSCSNCQKLVNGGFVHFGIKVDWCAMSNSDPRNRIELLLTRIVVWLLISWYGICLPICPCCKMYLSLLRNVFVFAAKCIRWMRRWEGGPKRPSSCIINEYQPLLLLFECETTTFRQQINSASWCLDEINPKLLQARLNWCQQDSSFCECSQLKASNFASNQGIGTSLRI